MSLGRRYGLSCRSVAGRDDDLRLHIAPVLLGAGKRLFDHLGNKTIELERTGVIESPYATHLFFTVRR